MTAKKPTKRPRKAKGGADEVEERIPLAEVEKLMLALSSNYAVSKALIETHGIHERTARRWIAKVREEWRQDVVTLDHDGDRAFYRARLLDILSRAKEQGELAIELAALKRYAEFQALDKPQVQQVEHRVSTAEDVSRWEPSTALEFLRDKGILPDLMGGTERGDEDG